MEHNLPPEKRPKRLSLHFQMQAVVTRSVMSVAKRSLRFGSSTARLSSFVVLALNSGGFQQFGILGLACLHRQPQRVRNKGFGAGDAALFFVSWVLEYLDRILDLFDGCDYSRI